MSQWEKLLQSIRNNPNSVRLDELDKVLRNTGFERKQSGNGSGHYRYVLGTDQIVVPVTGTT
ncbi:hypothetical protein JZ785_10000 [Alicyclobacillus curvatus]|nr:hypothetical protein JZ785_10000 [Alicyclobacillus curvatus]